MTQTPQTATDPAESPYVGLCLAVFEAIMDTQAKARDEWQEDFVLVA